jgi:hypothetical protein
LVFSLSHHHPPSCGGHRAWLVYNSENCRNSRKLRRVGLFNQHGDRCRERRLRNNASENHQCKIVLAMDTGREREREREACT